VKEHSLESSVALQGLYT